VTTTFKTTSFGRAEKAVRINSWDTPFIDNDLASIGAFISAIDAILIPKVEIPAHIELLSTFLDRFGRKAINIKLLASIESAKAIVNLREICQCSARLDALIFGAEDYCANVGITRSPNASELTYARGAIVTYAAANKLQAIDLVCVNFKDAAQLIREAEEGARMGFTGKQAIHPSQIDPIYAAFKPNPNLVNLATRILAENEINQAKGVGAFEIDGKMIDMPMVRWAESIMRKSKVTAKHDILTT